MKKIILVASLIGGLALLTGCQKEFGRGGEIRFVASSVSGPATRAVYSGEGTISNGLLTWERIDWQTNDVIRIWSDAAKTPEDVNYSDYKVTEVNTKSGDATRSQAKVVNNAGNGLNWDDVTEACDFWALYPASQAGSSTTNSLSLSINESQTPDDGLENAPMVAAVSDVSPKSEVTLEFYPAFTAFEITLQSKDEEITLNSFALTSTSTALSGDFTATVEAGGRSTYSCPTITDANGSVEYTFEEGTTISATNPFTFTILALPQLLKDLTLDFTVTIDGTAAHRKLALNYSNGNPVEFAACSKHRITGLAMPGGLWEFKYITLENEVIDWTDVDVSGLYTDNLPEASQFVVNGANNGRRYTSGEQTSPVEGRDATAYRQYWLMKSGTPTTVTFKIMAPEGGTYEIVPQGDVEQFTITVDDETITGSITGDIADKPESSSTPSETTVVKFTITSTTTVTDAVIYFKTYVTDGDGNKYSIDSETQLFDMRGYHYFVMNNSSTVQ